jgi:DNA-binding NarL/FixJ family response regulator
MAATDAAAALRHTSAVKVFLVEDSPMLRERLTAILSAIPGARTVGHAARASEAIAGIEREQPDVVVLDIQLEEGNGFDVLQALQRSAPQARAFVLTNFANDAYRRKAERLGARGFFDKSTEFDRLRDALAKRAA